MTEYNYHFKELVHIEREEGLSDRAIEVGIQEASADDGHNSYMCLRHLFVDEVGNEKQKNRAGVITFPSEMTDEEAVELVETMGDALGIQVSARPF